MKKKITGVALAAGLAVAGLTACGGNDNNSNASGNYCDDVKAAVAQVNTLQNPAQVTADKFNQMKDSVHSIADEAPADVKASWTVLANALDNLESAMSDAGLSMDDFGNLAKGQLPDNVTIGKLNELKDKLNSLGSPALTNAEQKIKADAKSTCNVTLPN